MKVADQYGVKEAAGDVWIPISFTQILTIAQWMNQIGADKLSSEAITAKAKAFKGPMAFGAPTLECGKYADAPAICNDQIKFFNYEGKGVFSAASDWIGPPSSAPRRGRQQQPPRAVWERLRQQRVAVHHDPTVFSSGIAGSCSALQMANYCSDRPDALRASPAVRLERGLDVLMA